MTNFDELDRYLTYIFDEALYRKQPEEHPDCYMLCAYQANELPPSEIDSIQEHLIQCTFCTDLLLDLQYFLEPSEDLLREEVSDLGAAVEWRKMKANSQEYPAKIQQQRRSLLAFRTLAALLLIGFTGLLEVYLSLDEALAAQTCYRDRMFCIKPGDSSIPPILAEWANGTIR